MRRRSALRLLCGCCIPSSLPVVYFTPPHASCACLTSGTKLATTSPQLGTSFRTGTLVPVTTASNAHPPLPSILLAGWWHLSGSSSPVAPAPSSAWITAAALLAVFRISTNILGTPAAVATTLLTALYPVWFAQSTLAHADIFAAAFTLWALSCYLQPTTPGTWRTIWLLP